jgi:hypothetical protein
MKPTLVAIEERHPSALATSVNEFLSQNQGALLHGDVLSYVRSVNQNNQARQQYDNVFVQFVDMSGVERKRKPY